MKPRGEINPNPTNEFSWGSQLSANPNQQAQYHCGEIVEANRLPPDIKGWWDVWVKLAILPVGATVARMCGQSAIPLGDAWV